MRMWDDPTVIDPTRALVIPGIMPAELEIAKGAAPALGFSFNFRRALDPLGLRRRVNLDPLGLRRRKGRKRKTALVRRGITAKFQNEAMIPSWDARARRIRWALAASRIPKLRRRRVVPFNSPGLEGLWDARDAGELDSWLSKSFSKLGKWAKKHKGVLEVAAAGTALYFAGPAIAAKMGGQNLSRSGALKFIGQRLVSKFRPGRRRAPAPRQSWPSPMAPQLPIDNTSYSPLTTPGSAVNPGYGAERDPFQSFVSSSEQTLIGAAEQAIGIGQGGRPRYQSASMGGTNLILGVAVVGAIAMAMQSPRQRSRR